VRHRLYVLHRGEAYHDEVKRELRFHRELDDLARSGNSLGNETYYREEVRRMTLMPWFDRVQQDVTYAWRGLGRSRAFTATFVATLALGLGVNAAMYSFLDQLFTRPPAGVVNPERVERLYLSVPSALARGTGAYGAFMYSRFGAVHDAARHPELVAAFTPSSGSTIVDGSVTDSARTIYATPDYFTVLGLRPHTGRFFVAEERAVETPTPVAVISDRLWRETFGAKPGVLGRSVKLGDRSVTIVGVAPAGFTGIDLNAGDVWLPLNMFPPPARNGKTWYQGTGNYLSVIARIDAPADRAQLVTAGATALRQTLDSRDPRDSMTTILTGPINEVAGPSNRSRETSLAQRLAGVTLLVLLIACANLANLLLVRATQRRREFAVRRALGVSRGRLIQQMLTESIVLCLIGAATTLLFASWAGTALRRLLFPTTHWSSPAVDLRVVGLTVLTAVVVAIVTGLVPAVGASNPDLVASLKATLSGGGAKSSRLQNTLLGLQAAVSVVLLVAAGLVVRSFDNVRSIDLGYTLDDMIVASTLSFPRDEQEGRVMGQHLAEVMERIRRRPDVRAASLANSTPMGGYAVGAAYLPGNDHRLEATFVVASGEHFAASGIRLAAGRGLSSLDIAGSERVAVVSERMAKEVWPNAPVIGQCLAIGKPNAVCTRIVGIARNTHRMAILEEGVAQYYLPASQTDIDSPSSIVVRVAGGHTDAVANALRAELERVIPPKIGVGVRTMSKVLEPQLRPWKMGAILFVALGVLALTVACVGIYGVVAYSMATRTQEMGIRIALGARMKDVLDLVLRDGMRVVSIGILVGVVSALALGRLIRSLLFGVVPNDLSTVIGAVAVLIGFAALACLAPAWRAGRIDPVTALRAD
jgi:predicted permease